MARGRRAQRNQRKKKQVVVSKVTSVSSTLRRPRPRRQRRAGRMRLGGMKPGTLAYAQSLNDPWNSSACIPDGANGVGCYSVKYVNSLGTGAAGTSMAFFLVPNGTGSNNYAYTGGTATTPVVSGNYVPAITAGSINSLYSETRAVSAGVRVTYTGNTQTDQGVLLIGQVAEGVPISQFNGATLVTAQSYFENYKLLPLRSGGQVTWRPQSVDDAVVYYSTSSTPGAVTAPTGVPTLAVIVYGATANTGSLLLVDAVQNFEGQYADQAFLPGGLRSMAPPAEAGWFENALNYVRELDPIMPYVKSTLTNVFNSPAFGSAMNSGIAMLTNPASRTGLPRLRYMDVD